MHPTEKMPGVEVALTVLHAGGKFDKNSYKVSGGLHGVGVSVVNALSERLEVLVDRDGKRHHMAFVARQDGQEARGRSARPRAPAPRSGSSPTPRSSPSWSSTTTTLADRLRELAFLNKGVTHHLKDERERPDEGGDLLRQGRPGRVRRSGSTGTRSRCTPSRSTFSATKDDVEVELALQYEDGYNENTFTFVNNINTHEGGTHLTGFKAALTRTHQRRCAKRRDFLKKEDFTLSGDDIREGLTCVLHVKVQEPQFEGQTKTKLGNSEVEGIVKTVVNEHLGELPRGAPAGRARTSSRRR